MGLLDSEQKNKEIIFLASVLSLISAVLVTIIALKDLYSDQPAQEIPQSTSIII